ncbi:MAG: ATP-binding cassette domain-containing protein, partial [bacterium]|nr:ATP-binding cassette domain-containing protein [bacterium]
FLKYKNFRVLLNRLDILSKVSTIKYGQQMLTQINEIRFSDLTKKVGNRLLFDNYNNIIERGKIVGLKGPNGSGKTTLVKLLRSFLYNSSIRNSEKEG